MAVISKGITLYYAYGGQEHPLTNLQEIPELGGSVEAIEITTLTDDAHRYTDGIKSYGDSLDFKFLYEADQFMMLNNFADKIGIEWIVSLPDGTSCSFGGTCSVKLDGVGVNAALTYTLSVKPNTAMYWD